MSSLRAGTARARWKRVALIVAGVIVSLIGVVVVSVWVLWTRLTALPDWASELAVEGDATGEHARPVVDNHWVDEPQGLDGELDRLDALRGAPPPVSVGAGGKPSTKSKQLRNFHVRKALEDPVLRKATRASKAEWKDGTLEAGLIIDLAVVEGEKLGENGKRFYSRAKSIFPGLGTTKVYVALIDKCVTVDGYLQLSDSPMIRVGDVEMSLSRVSKRLGLDPSKVRTTLNKEMRRLDLRDPNASQTAPVVPDYDGPI